MGDGYCIMVGQTCAAVFIDKRAMFRGLGHFSPHINVRIKKGQPTPALETRRKNKAATRRYTRPMQPGEFKL